jgi:hypothetical protein
MGFDAKLGSLISMSLVKFAMALAMAVSVPAASFAADDMPSPTPAEAKAAAKAEKEAAKAAEKAAKEAAKAAEQVDPVTGEKLICRTVSQGVGSVGGKRMCKTSKEWARLGD